MRSTQEIHRIQYEGTGLRLLSRREVGEAYRTARAKKMEFTSFWTRKRGKASK